MLCLSATAQMAAPGSDGSARSDQELLRRQQQEQEQRRQQERAPDVRLSAPQGDPLSALPTETPCFVISDLQVKSVVGPIPSDLSWVEPALVLSGPQSVLGQCVGAQGVAWLLDRAQKLLVERGFVTSRILAQAQDMSQGRLVLTLIPGRIRAIRLLEPKDPRANLVNIFPMQSGDVLNLRDIEQALENLKRVPTAEADIQIEPAGDTHQGDGKPMGDGRPMGDAQIGESDLVVSYRQHIPLRLSVSADDSGTKATGKYQGSVTVSYDNALTLSDLLYVTHTHALGGGDPGPRGNHADTFHYSLPIGYWTLGTTLSTSAYHQSVAGLNQTYVYKGSSENKEVKLSRMLMRDNAQKLSASVRAFQRKSNNFIDDTEVGVQRRVVGGWDATLNYKTMIQDATLEGSLAYKRGTGAFGAIPAPEEVFNEGTARFALVTTDATVALPFKAGAQTARYNTTWRMQNNRTALTPQDRFAVGGRHTVRGYDGEAVLSAERGWLWRNELSFALGDSAQEFYVGLDTGQVSGPSSESLVAKQLTGSVIGLRGALQKFNYDLYLGTPIRKPRNFTTAGSTAGFSLSASF